MVHSGKQYNPIKGYYCMYGSASGINALSYFSVHLYMEKKYAAAFGRLEKSKEDLLSLLADRDAQYISCRKSNKWSPLEQCYHVYLAEMLSRKYCVKKLSFNPELKEAGFLNQWRIWALKTIELLPLKFTAPEAISEQVFPESLTLETVARVWSEERQALRGFLEKMNPALINKEIYKQPTVGRLTISGMLEFFQFHLDRHVHHIKRDYGIGRH